MRFGCGILVSFAFVALSSVSSAQTLQCAAVKPLYKSVISALCSSAYVLDKVMNRVYDVVDPSLADFSRRHPENMQTPMGCGLGAIMLAGPALGMEFYRLGVSTMREVELNTPENKAKIEKKLASYARDTSEYGISMQREYRQALKMMESYPKNHVYLNYNRGYSWVDKGPKKSVYAATRAARLGLRGAAILSGIGVAFSVADFAFSADATGCDEMAQQYYSADRNDNCSPQNVIGPEVLGFLQLAPEEQDRILKENPKLCDVYANLSKAIDDEMANQYQVSDAHLKCDNKTLKGDVSYKNGDKYNVESDGLSAKVKSGGSSYDIQYTQDNMGRLAVKKSRER